MLIEIQWWSKEWICWKCCWRWSAYAAEDDKKKYDEDVGANDDEETDVSLLQMLKKI